MKSFWNFDSVSLISVDVMIRMTDHIEIVVIYIYIYSIIFLKQEDDILIIDL